ncbi:MAG TPA: S41 family peptidase [Candidatus Omnitrophota bacterium]|nr:S41 family peptidase [Candidatus Omnitrophota bacterium]
MVNRFKKFTLIILCAAVVLASATFAIGEIDKKEEVRKNDLYSQIELFSYALTTVQAAYVEEPTPKDLIYGSLKGMLSSLDPHSQFLTPEDFTDLKTETEGKFGGLGIEISIKDNLLTVVTPLEDTPAWRAGIKSLDKIVKIDDESTKDITLSEAVKKLRGKPGTNVKITIFRESEGKILDLAITREIIRIHDVKDIMILKDNIGYIRLTEFREESYKEFHKALEQLKQKGADSLILDLRNNPGGLLNIAIEITQEFLPEGQIIVSTKSRNPSQNSVAKSANRSGMFLQWPMAVLINEGSASGSEILAGALKDNKRAIIIGAKSFGKGSVQSVIPLPDGTGLKLTTSKYYTPADISIHGIGIEPDITVDPSVKELAEEKKEAEKTQKKAEEIFNSVQNGATPSSESNKLEETKKRLLDDNQVQAAINVIKGIKIFKK